MCPRMQKRKIIAKNADIEVKYNLTGKNIQNVELNVKKV
jgi:hypothetical protein